MHYDRYIRVSQWTDYLWSARCVAVERVVLVGVNRCSFRSTGALVSRQRWALFTFQGKQVEMYDEEYEPVNGRGYRGTIHGTTIACHCGCETTMKGAETDDAIVDIEVQLALNNLR